MRGIPNNPTPVEIKFWSRVSFHPTACWEWTKTRKKTGYGRFKSDGKAYQAHRVAWELSNGPIPESIEVCHICDNRGCVRPSHLFLGTHQENMADCSRKGRIARPYGESGPSSKLTAKEVYDMRRLFAEGVSRKELAVRFNTEYSNACLIIQGRTWPNLDEAA